MGNYYNPVKIIIDQIDVLDRVLNNLNPSFRKIVLLTRGGDFIQSQTWNKISKCLEKFEVLQLEVEISNPDIEDLYHYYKQIHSFKYECIIGIGGGSVLDLAKSLLALTNMEIDSTDSLRDVIKYKSYAENKSTVPWIGVPTTSGTGSEVTCWATIWDRTHGIKRSIDSKNLYANTAIIDANLTLTLPNKLTASTALDALCHATEAYWSKNSNEISRVYSLEAIKRIVNNIEKVLTQPKDRKLRDHLALGSLYAGLAFSNTRTTACHSISYPLTLTLGIDHGVAASLSLAKVMEINLPAIIEKEKLFEAFGVKDCHEVHRFIEQIHQLAGFSSHLRDYNANLEVIETIAENAFTKGRMDNNPVELTKNDVKKVLMSIF